MSKLSSMLIMAGLVSFAGAGYAQTTQPQPSDAATPRLTREQAKAEHDRVDATYKAEKEACNKLTDNAKDVCEAEAKGKQDVANAEIDYKRSGSERDRMKIAEVRAKADYAVAKERCENRPRDQQSACKKEAEATEKAAISSAKKARSSTS